MTGEITLRGRVLAIGGLKEKLLAAMRGGIKTVLIPKDNEKDLADVPDNVKEALTILPISLVDEALNAALVSPFSLEVAEKGDAKVIPAQPIAPEKPHSDDIVAH